MFEFLLVAEEPYIVVVGLVGLLPVDILRLKN